MEPKTETLCNDFRFESMAEMGEAHRAASACYMNPLARGVRPFHPVARRRELSACRKALARFSVRPPDPTRPIATLSGLQGQGLTWPLASAVVLLLGAAIGVANGVLVTVIGIDSFIATLGTGTLLYGFNEWYTGGQQVVAGLPDSFVNISGAVLGVPLPAIYVLVLSISLWVVFEYLPAGRAALGAEAAQTRP